MGAPGRGGRRDRSPRASPPPGRGVEAGGAGAPGRGRLDRPGHDGAAVARRREPGHQRAARRALRGDGGQRERLGSGLRRGAGRGCPRPRSRRPSPAQGDRRRAQSSAAAAAQGRARARGRLSLRRRPRFDRAGHRLPDLAGQRAAAPGRYRLVEGPRHPLRADHRHQRQDDDGPTGGGGRHGGGQSAGHLLHRRRARGRRTRRLRGLVRPGRRAPGTAPPEDRSRHPRNGARRHAAPRPGRRTLRGRGGAQRR